jgi:hypothetical protein
MLGYDEKRNYIRMNVDCSLTYKLAASDQVYNGRCTSLSGAGISFITSEAIEPGKGLEISVIPENNVTPPMTAFIEVVRNSDLENGEFEIAATIKSIKGT